MKGSRKMSDVTAAHFSSDEAAFSHHHPVKTEPIDLAFDEFFMDFQDPTIKQEFPLPIDSWAPDWYLQQQPAIEVVCPPADLDPYLETYHDMIMHCVQADVQAVSNKLGISKDPTQWNVTQVRAWVLETARTHHLCPVHLDNFNMPGYLFCQMGADEFYIRAPECAEKLKGFLDIWLAAVDYDKRRLQRPHSLPLPTGTHRFAGGDFGSTHLSPLNTFEQSMLLLHAQPQLDSPALTPSTPDSGIVTDGDDCVQQQQIYRQQRFYNPAYGINNAPANGNHIHLWQFIRQLLDDPQKYAHCVRWISKEQGIFKIENSGQLAKCWGQRKNRPAMNYDKLSRSLRQYYKKGILKKTPRSQRLVYQFCQPYSN